MIDIGKKLLFNFYKMFENVQFFSLLHFKIEKRAFMTQKLFFEKYQCGYQKHAEFYADFKFVDADLNKCP
jgi:hypothetical protein